MHTSSLQIDLNAKDLFAVYKTHNVYLTLAVSMTSLLRGG